MAPTSRTITGTDMTKWIVAALLALASAAQAAPVYTESVIRAPVDASGRRVLIDVTVFRPPGAGPFPVVVLANGSPRAPEERRADGRQRLVTKSLPFLAMGMAVIVPTRRGYGTSGGEWAEGYGTCADRNYYAGGLEPARDMRAAVDAIRHEAWADTRHVVLAGQSAGGFGAVAAATTPFDGLVAVINFAGGRGSLGPGQVCGESRLVEAMALYGRSVRVPAVGLYRVDHPVFRPQ